MSKEIITKKVNEDIVVNIDFSGRMGSGDTITAISSTSLPNDLTFGVQTWSGQVGQVTISDGSIPTRPDVTEQMYKVFVQVTTANGQTLINEGDLKVINPEVTKLPFRGTWIIKEGTTQNSIPDFHRGDTERYIFDFGKDIDITNRLIKFTLKENEDDPDTAAALQISATAGDDPEDDQTHGLMYLTISSTDTANLEPGASYYGDFQYSDVGAPAIVNTILIDKSVKIIQDITTT